MARMYRTACLLSALVLAPSVAIARGHELATPLFYLDSDRCSVLAEQFLSLGGRTAAAPVAETGLNGIALCDASRFAEGADALARAIELLGATPAKPRPRLLLH